MSVWGSEQVIIDMVAGRVAVRGPVEFVREIDWPRVEAVALLLARALGPVDALQVAVWREYRGWRRRVLRAGTYRDGQDGQDTGSGFPSSAASELQRETPMAADRLPADPVHPVHPY
jgi:hypothetical protein